jgi:hypothetical protein
VLEPIHIPADWSILPGVPPTRGDCPKERPCPFLECREHLWSVESAERPGRRHEGGLPPMPAIRAPTQETCALDIADRRSKVKLDEGQLVAEIARVLGVTRRQVRSIVARIKRKLRNNPDASELLALMMGAA